ncbi:MAG: AAA family ATPase [Phycisphaerae bacterium]|nr:AAA family ATPase [Phycisphaerae bacterium]
MRLTKFTVTNYRSIEDSGPIEVADRTALVGRNESGKTNLLLALAALNPPDGPKALNEVKDLPRERKLAEFRTDLPFIETEWSLSEDEAAELAQKCPSLSGQVTVEVGQRYNAERWVAFPGSKSLSVDTKLAASHAQKAQKALRTALGALDESAAKPINDAVVALKAKCEASAADSSGWSSAALSSVQALRKAAAAANFTLTEDVETPLNELQDYCEEVQAEKERLTAARNYIASLLPTFIFLDEYPEIHGHQNLQQLVSRLDNPSQMSAADHNFMKLMKVAGLDPKLLRQLISEGAEKRQLLTNRASATVTAKIRELWKDRELTVRFALDAEYFDILVSDPTSVFPVEVNLDERSRGFRWFFSFFITFAADTQGGPAEDAIILLDEPGLYLHALAQHDLLQLFRSDFENQILYTTHSPFMIPVDELGSIRTVSIAPKHGTTVSNDPMGDSRTLFPLQAALGYNIAQALFVGGTNVVVEGVTDFWYISAASEYLATLSRPHLPEDATLTPVGGAQKVSYMVALLASQSLKVVVLLDSEKKARETAADLAKQKLIRDDCIQFVGGAFAPEREEADIEDLLDPAVFEKLVRESYAKELASKSLSLNANIPRIVKRFEEAFVAAGMEFHKTRPARLFLRKLAEDPSSVLDSATLARFEALFKLLSQRLAKVAASGEGPFGYSYEKPGKTPIGV